MTVNYNPFSLQTASNALANKALSFPKKVYYAVGGSLNDIFVKNPYDLTIGNFKHCFLNGNFARHTLIKKIGTAALISVGAFYTAMLYGSGTYLAGHLIRSIGASWSLPLLTIAGEKTKKIGEILFYCGSVPLYALTYALPKKAIEVAPKVARTVLEKVRILANTIFQRVILPAYKFVRRIITAVADKIHHALQVISQKVEIAAIWTFNNLIKPLWKHVIRPIAKAISKAFDAILNSICEVVSNCTQKIESIAIWTFNSVIKPLWKHIIAPIAKTISKAFHATVKLVSNLVRACALKIRKAAVWIFDNLISHGITLIKTISKKLADVVSHVARSIRGVAHLIFENVLKPLWNHTILPITQLIRRAAVYTGAVLSKLVAKVVQISSAIFQSVKGVLYSVTQKIAGALYEIQNVTYQAWEKVAAHF